MAELIAAVGKLPSASDGRPDKEDHYGALVRTIAGQQLSVKAARAIYGRLTARFTIAHRRRRRSSTTSPKSCAPPPGSHARR